MVKFPLPLYSGLTTSHSVKICKCFDTACLLLLKCSASLLGVMAETANNIIIALRWIGYGLKTSLSGFHVQLFNCKYNAIIWLHKCFIFLHIGMKVCLKMDFAASESGSLLPNELTCTSTDVALATT